MTQFLQLLVTGLSIGSIYAVISVGFVLVYKATEVFNFAQGNLMVVGAYLGYTFIDGMGLPAVVGALAAVACAAIIGILLHYTMFRPMLGKPVLSIIMATIGLALIIDALIIILYGPIGLSYPEVLPKHVLNWNGVRISTLDLVIIGIAALCVIGFGIFFRRSNLGLQMRATAENFEAASLSGVNSDRVFATALAIGTGMAAIGGVLLATTNLLSVELSAIAFLAFPAIVIGGLESIPGAVIGGLAVGIIQNLAAGYISSDAQTVVVYIVLLVVLMVRPYGLFGQREIVRV
ncbi:MAG: branched-chain amino acid ABC transporter permease [Nostocoides sp.]